MQWSGNGHWYEPVLAQTRNITWTEARDEAAARGGYLATISSAEENSFVYGLFEGNPDFWFKGYLGPWLGGYQEAGAPEPAGGWRWVTGEPWNYTHWNAGEPSNGWANEDSLHYWLGGGWNDAPNDLSVYQEVIHGYIAEWVPEPTTLSLLALGGLALLRRRKASAGKR
jgi:hypothetical protein